MLISNFELICQQAQNTCGYATASMILSFLEGQHITEDVLLRNYPLDKMGITFNKVMEVYNRQLKKHAAEIVYGSKEEMLSLIKSSLETNLPFHIQYLTSNLMEKNEPVLHYAALIGYDKKEESFTLADPYGSMKIIQKEDFFNAISFRNECLPDIIKQRYPSNMMIRFHCI